MIFQIFIFEFENKKFGLSIFDPDSRISIFLKDSDPESYKLMDRVDSDSGSLKLGVEWIRIHGA